jgi:hypothetical protein
VTIDADGTVDIDVASAALSGTFTLNGAGFPADPQESANFYLRDTETGNLVFLGLSNDQTYAALVTGGVYEVVYQYTLGSSIPVNEAAVVSDPLTISADQSLDIDVTSAALAGAFTLNGAAFPADPQESADVFLRDTETGDLVFLGTSDAQVYTTIVTVGTYEAAYAFRLGSSIPQNRRSIVTAPVLIAGDRTWNIDVEAVALAGAFSLNGSSFPASPQESATIYLRDTRTREPVVLGKSEDQVYTAIVVTGSYDAVYEYTLGSTIPLNRDAMLFPVTVVVP